MAVYYRFYDKQCDRYLFTGYNGTLDNGVRDELIEYLDDVEGEEIFKDCSIETICDVAELTVEKRLGIPFEEHPEEII